MSELKPCPFCGNKAECVCVDKDWVGHEYLVVRNIYLSKQPGFVRCSKCSVGQLRRYTRMSSAIKAWNTRKGAEK